MFFDDTNKKKKVFLTGATGFIGSELVTKLIQQGFDVTVFLRYENQINEFINLPVNCIIGSFSDKSLLKKSLKGQKIVIHAAALISGPDLSGEKLNQENVETTRQLLSCLDSSIEKLVYISTVHVLGFHHHPKRLPLDENSEYNPSTRYGASKAEAEQYVKKVNIPYVIIRPTMVYGPGDRYGFVQNMIQLLADKKFQFLPGGGNNFVHLIYIDDLINGIMQAIESKQVIKQIYILGGKKPIRVKDLVKEILLQTKQQTQIIPIPMILVKIILIFVGAFAERIDTLCGNRFFSIKKAQREFGFNPRVSYREGISNALKASNPIWDRRLVQSMAEQHETPFFLFSEEILINRYKKLKDSFSRYYKPVRVYYSAKTNFNNWVLAKLRNVGSDIEIACGQELLAARKAGFNPQQMCFDGPVKTEEDIEYAIREGINYFNFDSLEDAKKVSRIAVRMKKTVHGGFRIDIQLKGFLWGVMESYIRKFGVPIQEAVATYEAARKLPNITLDVISTHIGSQVIKIAPYITTVKQLVSIIEELEKRNFSINEVNLGGGFPSATLAKTTPLRFLLLFFKIDFKDKVPTLQQFGEEISKTFYSEVKRLKSKPILAIEPGRSIASPMGILVSRAKIIKGKWVFSDASKYFIPESAFFIHQKLELIKTKNPVSNSHRERRYNIVGSSLNTSDIFAMDLNFPIISKDDIITIYDAGAYSISRAVPFTVLLPEVYGIERNGNIKLIQRKGVYEDSFSRDLT